MAKSHSSLNFCEDQFSPRTFPIRLSYILPSVFDVNAIISPMTDQNRSPASRRRHGPCILSGGVAAVAHGHTLQHPSTAQHPTPSRTSSSELCAATAPWRSSSVLWRIAGGIDLMLYLHVSKPVIQFLIAAYSSLPRASMCSSACCHASSALSIRRQNYAN